VTKATANADGGAQLTGQKDGTITVGGKVPATDLYTVIGNVKLDKPITAIRLEVLADPALPAKGPGRADNGNFVLNNFKLSWIPQDKPDAKATAIKLTAGGQIFAQDGFPAANALLGNPQAGWATAPRFGQDNAALFKFDKPANSEAGVSFTATLDQKF